MRFLKANTARHIGMLSVKPTVLLASLVKRGLQRTFRNCLQSQRAASSKEQPSLETATLVTSLEREGDSRPTLLSRLDKLSQGHGDEDFNPLPRSSIFPYAPFLSDLTSSTVENNSPGVKVMASRVSKTVTFSLQACTNASLATSLPL